MVEMAQVCPRINKQGFNSPEASLISLYLTQRPGKRGASGPVQIRPGKRGASGPGVLVALVR